MNYEKEGNKNWELGNCGRALLNAGIALLTHLYIAIKSLNLNIMKKRDGEHITVRRGP